MALSSRVATFPWHRLPQAERATLRWLHQFTAAQRPPALSEVARHLSDLLAEPVAVRLVCWTPSSGPGALDALSLAPLDGRSPYLLTSEPELQAAVATRLMGRRAGFSDPRRAAGPALRGAWAALVSEALRRSRLALRVSDAASANAARTRATAAPWGSHARDPERGSPARHSSPAEPRGEENAPTGLTSGGSQRDPGDSPRGVSLKMSVEIAGRAFWAELWAPQPDELPPPRAPSLAELGALPVRLTLVISWSLADRYTLAELRVGDVWVPGEPPTLDANATGTAWAVAATAEQGFLVHLASDGRLVLGERQGTVPLEAAAPERDCDVDETDRETLTTTAVLDAPVIVRVELGSVTLSARDWGSLVPGDVLQTGQPLGSVATLRVAGQAIAEGELVSVEGELGVRITRLAGAEESP